MPELSADESARIMEEAKSGPLGRPDILIKDKGQRRQPTEEESRELGLDEEA